MSSHFFLLFLVFSTILPLSSSLISSDSSPCATSTFPACCLDFLDSADFDAEQMAGIFGEEFAGFDLAFIDGTENVLGGVVGVHGVFGSRCYPTFYWSGGFW